ncbi:MAG: hypothetical protein WD875_04630 [Pirellulales bacterium]
MPFLVGMDEAGYGPNLGPLVVAATVWRVGDSRPRDLYDSLGDAITRDAADARATGRLAIADSKQLYQPQRGLADLERGVLAAVASIGERPRTFDELLAIVDADRGADRVSRHPRERSAIDPISWFAHRDEALPVAAEATNCDVAANRLRAAMQSAECRLVCVRTAVVQPQTFNDLIDAHDGKGAALSETTLGLLSLILSRLPPEPALVICDKHGGRNRYGELLQGRFGDDLVEVRREGRAASDYRWGPSDRRIEISFRSGGEAFLPAALASMAAKYIRELSMRAFNAFWQAELPSLRPTAGYPVDARRFRRDIAAAQRRLGISDRVLWRNR